MNKPAKLIVKHEGQNLRYQLRSGNKGTGAVLYECTAWDNPRATEQAEQWVSAYAQQNGITINNDMEDGLY